uniref:Uncharacterized protein n=1 Tax=Brassica oleracea var. oleracea TaxID=109376 RepID=A0A0D3AYU6_BRAOL
RTSSGYFLGRSSIDAFLDINTSIDRNIPTDIFLGIFRGKCPSEISRRSSPSVYSEDISDKLVILRIFSEVCFLGIPSGNSEGFPRKEEIPRNYFRRLVSLVCRRNNDIPTKFRRFFPSESLLFSCNE